AHRPRTRLTHTYIASLGHPFLFFSSRRRHTRFKCDWSSDVCSSDLSCSEQPSFYQSTWNSLFHSLFLFLSLSLSSLSTHTHTSAASCPIQTESLSLCVSHMHPISPSHLEA